MVRVASPFDSWCSVRTSSGDAKETGADPSSFSGATVMTVFGLSSVVRTSSGNAEETVGDPSPGNAEETDGGIEAYP